MSLNKLTDISTVKDWMNINCNDLKCVSFDAGSISTDMIAIDQKGASPVYLTMTNDDLPADSKTYGMYSAVGSNAFWLAKFNDLGGANVNYFCLEGSGDISVPTSKLTITAGGLDLNSAGALTNVPLSSATGSFYETFASVGNVYSGCLTTPEAKEFTATRTGNVVVVNVGGFVAPSNSVDNITSSIPLPTTMRPQQGTRVVIQVFDNSVAVVGNCLVSSTTGLLLFGAGMGSTFQGAGNAGFNQVMLTYSTV